MLVLFCLPLLIMAQAPQGFTYQGVATDNNGFELQNQNIAIKASLLSSSATGTTVWQETHNTTTDTFGLFNVTIGEGTSTGNGSSATFSEIDWGAASHFMKVEIDVNGGSNYVHVGTSQMMSVPYALYAENINMDSVINYLTNDSAFMDSMGVNSSIGSFNNHGIHEVDSSGNYEFVCPNTSQPIEITIVGSQGGHGCSSKMPNDSRGAAHGGGGGLQMKLTLLYFATEGDTLHGYLGEHGQDCTALQAVCSQWASSGGTGVNSSFSINNSGIFQINGSGGGQGGYYSCSQNFPNSNGGQGAEGSYLMLQGFNSSGVIIIENDLVSGESPSIKIRW